MLGYGSLKHFFKPLSMKALSYHNVFDPWPSCDTGAST